MSRLIRTVGVALVLLLGVRAADASDHLRCGNRFVRHGDSKFEVLRHCGEPVFKDRISGDAADAIEQWVYQPSWTRFPRMITFVSGRVARIERLDD